MSNTSVYPNAGATAAINAPRTLVAEDLEEIEDLFPPVEPRTPRRAENDFSLRELAGRQMQRLNAISGNFALADLSRVDIQWSVLANANLMGADLTLTDFRGTELNGANLSFANLVETNLGYTNLRGADFTGANISGVNIEGADLTGAQGLSPGLEGMVGMPRRNVDGSLGQPTSNADNKPSASAGATSNAANQNRSADVQMPSVQGETEDANPLAGRSPARTDQESGTRIDHRSSDKTPARGNERITIAAPITTLNPKAKPGEGRVVKKKLEPAELAVPASGGPPGGGNGGSGDKLTKTGSTSKTKTPAIVIDNRFVTNPQNNLNLPALGLMPAPAVVTRAEPPVRPAPAAVFERAPAAVDVDQENVSLSPVTPSGTYLLDLSAVNVNAFTQQAQNMWNGLSGGATAFTSSVSSNLSQSFIGNAANTTTSNSRVASPLPSRGNIGEVFWNLVAAPALRPFQELGEEATGNFLQVAPHIPVIGGFVQSGNSPGANVQNGI